MDKIVDHLFIFKGEGKITDYWGSYSEYKTSQSITNTISIDNDHSAHDPESSHSYKDP
jgi:ATP-binding cassette subfamily F protein uup